MWNFKLGYKSGGSRNYLCVETEEEISGYQLKMLEANEIPGLLRVHGTKLNGEYCLNYDITGMQLLKDALESRSIRGEKAKRLLLDLLSALLSTEDYFLSYTHCLTELEYLYLDERQNPAVAYLPFEGEGVTSEDTVKQLYQELLAEYFGEENEPFFMELLRYVNKKDFSVAGLKKLLQATLAEKESVATRQEAEETVPVWKPEEKQPEEKEKPVKEKQGLFEKLLGGKKEKKDGTEASQQKEESIPVPPIPVPKIPMPKIQVQKVAVPKMPASKRQDKADAAPENRPEEGQWHGTVMLSEDAVGQGKTVMLGMGSEACLYNNNRRIDITYVPFTIGKKNTDYVLDRDVISRKHATLSKQQGRYCIRDENSSNHTYVNDEQLPPFTERLLQSGDRIRLADEELVFSIL